MMENKENSLFCSKPFEWFEVTQLDGRGGVYMCCPSWLDTSVGNLRQQPVAEIWNSEQAQAIRRSVLDGTFEYCSRVRCPYLKSESGPVQRRNEVADERLKTVLAQDLTILPYGPLKIICTYDQSCNLSCPSCRTKVIVESEHKEAIQDIQTKLEAEALKDAEFLDITGSGDPFGSPYFRKWLQTMRRSDMPKLERIHLHTNGQLWTRKMWSSISDEIRPLVKSAEISIDAGSAETYAINRRGGSFRRLIRNLEFISELRAQGALDYLKISMVVQNNNFREMPALVRLGQRIGVDEVYFSQLVNWGAYTETEYEERAVHLPGHRSNGELASLLEEEIFEAPIVTLGNLSDLKRKPNRQSNKAASIARTWFARLALRRTEV